ncbi:D-aminoacyl-tRNA deacylase [Candidatus Bipolaricaulota bacterium]
MRIVVQRVRRASVDVDGARISEIGRGLLLLVGIAPADVRVDLEKVARKIATLRIFADEEGKMNRSILEAGGEILAVSQFTLFGDTRKGRRPSFVDAALPEIAEPLFEAFAEAVAREGVPVSTGRFGATMAVELINDGPVTLIIEVEPATV